MRHHTTPGRPTGWKTRRAAMFGLTLLVVVAICLALASCGGASSATTTAGPATTSGAGGTQVVMKSFAFEPATVTVKVGDSVTWTNQDSANHTVVADNGEFKSGDLANGGTFTFAFTKAGSYPYHCSIHPSMKGTVVVQ
jgi:plastocyanin